MSSSDDRDSVFNEPHLTGRHVRPDPSEFVADEVLRAEGESDQSAHEGQGVYDEPDIFPNQTPQLIETDWSCSACGYNLRGLMVGTRCPECNHIELYRPPPPDAAGYRTLFQQRAASTGPMTGWWIAWAAMVCGGPFAVVGALIENSTRGLSSAGLIVAVVFAPAVEEVMKIALAAVVIETRPYLFQRAAQIQWATLGTAAIFAAIENVLYLGVWISNPSAAIVAWRWTVCVALHIGCTAIATQGLIAVWRRSMTEQRPPRILEGQRALMTAIVIHGLYNASATGIEWLLR